MSSLTPSFGVAILWLTLGSWLFGPHGPAGAREHYPRALAILTTEQGREAADFSLEDPTGKVHRLRDYRGKVVLLSFGATW